MHSELCIKNTYMQREKEAASEKKDQILHKKSYTAANLSSSKLLCR